MRLECSSGLAAILIGLRETAPRQTWYVCHVYPASIIVSSLALLCLDHRLITLSVMLDSFAFMEDGYCLTVAGGCGKQPTITWKQPPLRVKIQKKERKKLCAMHKHTVWANGAKKIYFVETAFSVTVPSLARVKVPNQFGTGKRIRNNHIHLAHLFWHWDEFCSLNESKIKNAWEKYSQKNTARNESQNRKSGNIPAL